MPFLYGIYGESNVNESIWEIKGFWDVILNYIFPAIAVILFWVYKSATPGKILIGAKIVDADSGEKPAVSQLIVRYIGYFPASIIFGLGILWVAFDKRKQGWHDKIARTVVVRQSIADDLSAMFPKSSNASDHSIDA